MKPKAAILAAALVALGACNTFQNALGGEGADGAHFVSLFWVFVAVCAVMYAAIVGSFLLGLWRARRPRAPLTVDEGKHQEEPAIAGRLLAAWAILIAVGLTILTVASFFTDRSNAKSGEHPQLLVNVTGNQWWWDVQYSSGDVSKSFRTANELHLPVGVPVEVKLQSNDVIHSFWVPNLAGKQDLIPGRVTDIQLLARKTGLFRGQCAEFCGVQHAHMALDVTVESLENFRKWVTLQQRAAFAPQSPVELAGYRFFTARNCSACHAITGSPASATIGPDLTHFASRQSIAAGTLPMSAANVQAWIADPQRQKPGSNMPKVGLTPDELRALTAFMERLK
ncbi:MAG: cytochrome c oxidase subunit [Sphingomonadales bacterium]|nr:cytochrome c oxidase subunit [Sphingomonadales bacterium]